MCGCLSWAPNWGPGPQPKHVPQKGIEPATPCFAGWHSIHCATQARAVFEQWCDLRSALEDLIKMYKINSKNRLEAGRLIKRQLGHSHKRQWGLNWNTGAKGKGKNGPWWAAKGDEFAGLSKKLHRKGKNLSYPIGLELGNQEAGKGEKSEEDQD